MVAYEFIDGGDLRAMIADPQRIATGETIRQIGEQVGGAVEVLWSRRVVHRDIKPENVVRSHDGSYLLVDVGFAQHLDLTTMTAPWGQPGTMGYRSPEQCGGRRRLTIHSDVFSLGVTLYEVAAKVHPWSHNQAVMGRVSAPPLGGHRGDLDPRLVRLVHEMIQGRPGQRPADPGMRFRLLGGI
jgi:serine/threonine-protein kinase